MVRKTGQKRRPKAVGLLSGGLDSTLAARIIKDLGVEVYGIYFAMPWGCCNKNNAMEAAEKLDIPFLVLQLNEQYLEIIKKPKHGYGAVLNPCVDCRVHMFGRARQYMDSINADFVFTGEVLGQRPMSQLRHSMSLIEKETGLTGRLLRPLCAQLMDPTIPETEGLIDRTELLALNGRSRQPQLKLADELNISDYSAPAGGCLLTDKHFATRMKDTFKYGYRNFRETIALKWGRHFRINSEFKAILGRDEKENNSLIAYAHQDDYVFELIDKRGPTLILKGYNPGKNILTTAAGLVRKYSRYRDDDTTIVEYWPVNDKNQLKQIHAPKITDQHIEAITV